MGTVDPSAVPAAIDLNCDLGEGFGVWHLTEDDALLDVVTSANVACGYHAGDATTMRRVCRAAVGRRVSIGAQVGYRDLAGFGRRAMDVPPDELAADVLAQIGALAAMARAAGGRVSYVKPHGAMYHRLVTDEAAADAVTAAIGAGAAVAGGRLAVLGPPGSALLSAAAARGLRPVREAFADRAYGDDGRLVPRDRPGAVHADPARVLNQALSIATGGVVETVSGQHVPVTADSLCLHGDSPAALDSARAVRAALAAAGVVVTSFAGVEPDP